MYVCCGNPQPAFHRLNSKYFIVFRDTVNHLHLGFSIDLVRAVDHAFAEISWKDHIVPLWHVETEATDVSPDLTTLGVI